MAIEDFATLTDAFADIRRTLSKPLSKLKRALRAVVSYGQRYPARYRLLFSDPDIAAQGGALEAAAMQAFIEFAAIVDSCQASGELPDIPNADLSGLIYASVHGLIDLEAGGRMRKEKGLASISEAVELLIRLFSRRQSL